MAAVPRLLVALDATSTPAGIDRAVASGADGVLVRPGAVPPSLVRQAWMHLAVAAVVPNMPQLLRDAADRGAPRAALDRLRPGGARAWLRLAVTGLTHVRAAAAGDFAGLIPMLMELDRAALGRAPLRAVVLAAPLTDLLLAAQHGACFAHLVRFVHRRVGVAAAFETLNLGHLLPRLAAWGVAPDFVVGPMNPAGYRMKPSASAVLAAVRASGTPVVATDLTAGGRIPGAGAPAWAAAHGAAGVVMSLGDVGDVDGVASRGA